MAWQLDAPCGGEQIDVTEDEALDAVKAGVRRARCILVDAEFRADGALLICAKKAGATVSQIGVETLWRSESAEQLTERTRRFCEHWCLKQPYHWKWDRAGSIH